MIGIYFLTGAAFLLMSRNAMSPEKISPTKNPDSFDELFKRYAALNGLEWKFLKTIAMNESSLGNHPRVKFGLNNPKDIEGSKSEDGLSWGIMQMTLITARDFDKNATAEKLNNAEYSIKLASQFIASLKRQFGSKIRDIAMAYNQGAGNQKRFIQLEMSGDLKRDQYAAARNYWIKFQNNYFALFKERI